MVQNNRNYQKIKLVMEFAECRQLRPPGMSYTISYSCKTIVKQTSFYEFIVEVL